LISILRALAVPSGMGVRFTSSEPGRNFFNAAPLTFGALHRQLLNNYIVVSGELQVKVSPYVCSVVAKKHSIS
jgi:hypothetical protein